MKLKKELPLLIIICSAFAIGVYVYPQLPDKVPSHWNFSGQVDGYSSRIWGAFGLPLLMAGLYLLFSALPLIDPKKENYVKFSGTYEIFKYSFMILFYLLYLVVLAASLGYPVNVGRVVPLGMAVLFIIIGNYLTTVRHNYFLGVRTPWTLSSEEVWRKTHRIAGRLWVGSGIVGGILLLFNVHWGGMVFLGLIIGTAVFSIIYSWWCFQRTEKS